VEAHKVLKTLIPPPDDPATGYALAISKLMQRAELEKAAAALPKLFASPYFKKHAEVALTRCEVHLGQIVQAQARLAPLLEKEPRNIRLLCELAESYKRNSQFNEAVGIYDKIHDLHPQMNIKIWDQILMLVELDQLDQATVLLDGLLNDPTFRELAVEGLAHVMGFLGMGAALPGVLKAHPELTKQYLITMQSAAPKT
jgi:Flp pilus assembly protein TadD